MQSTNGDESEAVRLILKRVAGACWVECCRLPKCKDGVHVHARTKAWRMAFSKNSYLPVDGNLQASSRSCRTGNDTLEWMPSWQPAHNQEGCLPQGGHGVGPSETVGVCQTQPTSHVRCSGCLPWAKHGIQRFVHMHLTLHITHAGQAVLQHDWL